MQAVPTSHGRRQHAQQAGYRRNSGCLTFELTLTETGQHLIASPEWSAENKINQGR